MVSTTTHSRVAMTTFNFLLALFGHTIYSYVLALYKPLIICVNKQTYGDSNLFQWLRIGCKGLSTWLPGCEQWLPLCSSTYEWGTPVYKHFQDFSYGREEYIRANARTSAVVAEGAYTTVSGSVNGSFVVTALIQSNRNLPVHPRRSPRPAKESSSTFPPNSWISSSIFSTSSSMDPCKLLIFFLSESIRLATHRLQYFSPLTTLPIISNFSLKQSVDSQSEHCESAFKMILVSSYPL